MTRIRLPYIHEFRDRHGTVRRYFRRHGRRLPLPGVPGSSEFMAAYQAALADEAPPETGADRTISGSVSALVVSWYSSAEFKQLADTTKTTYRGIIERFRAEHGEKPVKMLKPEHVRRQISAKADTPAAANNLLKVLRMLMRFAVEDGWRTTIRPSACGRCGIAARVSTPGQKRKFRFSKRLTPLARESGWRSPYCCIPDAAGLTLSRWDGSTSTQIN